MAFGTARGEDLTGKMLRAWRARRSGSSEPRRRINGEMRLPQRDHVFRLVLLPPPQKLI